MHIFYRMSPKNSAHEARRPRHGFDKLALARMCLKSFNEAFRDTNPLVHFLLDGCGSEWDDMIDHTTVLHHKIEHLESNQNDSYLYQLDLAKDVNDYVLFQEDDYVYLPNTGQKLLDAMKVLEFVSPYDHGEFYTRNTEFHKPPFDIKLVGEQHWRTIDFCTMTYGCHSARLLDYWDALHLHGFWDKDTWTEMGKRGAKLWTPIPSLATHMHKDFLSPGILWEGVFNGLDK
jgi:hypothetical protein